MEESVSKLIDIELENANKKFPLFASEHEGYAVLLEEVEECDDEMATIQGNASYLWSAVKVNNSEWKREAISTAYDAALNLACEAIQVAAMCKKYEMFLDGKK